jgi:hypothetical protein
VVALNEIANLGENIIVCYLRLILKEHVTQLAGITRRV